jgi:uncharacterized protein YndB with AHSA1/START domain
MTSLTLVRRVRASPATLFEAMTTAEGIAHWWGPDDGPVLIAESDPREGGRYRVRFRMLDGSEHESSGEFLELKPPTSIVMSWRWTEGGADPGQSRVEITLRPVPEGAEITFTHARLVDEESSASHGQGWTGSLDKLAAYFEGR